MHYIYYHTRIRLYCLPLNWFSRKGPMYSAEFYCKFQAVRIILLSNCMCSEHIILYIYIVDTGATHALYVRIMCTYCIGTFSSTPTLVLSWV